MKGASTNTTTTTTAEFEVVNALGNTIYTSSEEDLARRYAREKSKIHGPLDVQTVTRTITVTRRRIYRTRKLKAAAPAPIAPADNDLEIPTIRRVA